MQKFHACIQCLSIPQLHGTALLFDGQTFPAEIKGKHMYVTSQTGGNQGKIIKTKYDILDIQTIWK